MRVDWRGLAALCDAAVDRQWGEPVEIKPWQTADYGTGSPDSTRDVIAGTAVLFFNADQTNMPGGFDARMVEADIHMSCAEDLLIRSNARQDDRVHFPERDGTPNDVFSISLIMPDGTGRATVHLVRVRS